MICWPIFFFYFFFLSKDQTWYFQPFEWKDPIQTVCAADSFERSDSGGIGIHCTLLCRWVQQHCYENTWLVLIWQLMCWASCSGSVQSSFCNIPLLVHMCYWGTYLVVLVVKALCDEAAEEVGWVCGDQQQISPPLSAGETTRVSRHHGTLMAEEAKKLAAYAAVDNHIQVRLCIYLRWDTLTLLALV